VRGSGLTRKSRANAQVLSLESKAEALRRLGCGAGGVVLRGDSIYISTVYYDTSATTASFTIRVIESQYLIPPSRR
jgi:hypothetical protein